MKGSIIDQVEALFEDQLANWPLAKKNFEALAGVQTKHFSLDCGEITVQFNPARMVSSGAKVDAATIAKRACFLCEANRPAEQRGVAFGDYTILLNPFPIFPHHLTIVRGHEDQRIVPYVGDMMSLAKELPGYVVFYNGARCGASAPDHMHFQAGDIDFMPLSNDYMSHRVAAEKSWFSSEVGLYFMPEGFGRTVVGMESGDAAVLADSFRALCTEWEIEPGEEPMMNVVCWYADDKWQLLVMPRANFRPHQYGSGAAPELLVSPATVEMGGVIITPILEHFERIGIEDIKDIYRQVSLMM